MGRLLFLSEEQKHSTKESETTQQIRYWGEKGQIIKSKCSKKIVNLSNGIGHIQENKIS